MGQVGRAEVVDGHRVDPAAGVEIDRLDVVEVHHDGADVAGEADPPAVGRDFELLVGVGPVERQAVGAGLALDRVAAVARVPDDRVVARPGEDRVVAPVGIDRVGAVAAQDPVGRVGPGDGVGVGAAVEGERTGVADERIGTTLAGEGGRLVGREDAVRLVDGERICAVAAVHDDRREAAPIEVEVL